MTRICVLIVDDDAEDAELAQLLLRDADAQAYRAEVVDTVANALLRLTQDGLDVALVDHRLGADSGIDLIRKAVALGCEAPLLLLTGVGDEETDREALQAGAAGYLSKDGLTPARLARAIRYAVATRRAERHRVELMREQAARQRAEAATESRDRFLAIVSHELRNPLNAILGWSEILLEAGGESELVQKGLRAIHRNSVQQAKLISDLIDGAQINGDALSLELVPTDVGQVIASAVDDARIAVERAGIDLEVNVPATFPTIRADPGRIEQVLGNLLGNATKFTPRGGKIRVDAEVSPEGITLRVSDTGRGIGPEFLPQVFNRSERRGASSGLGLGLWIAQAIVEGHGGTIEAHSDGDHAGATFVVHLRVRGDESDPVPVRRRTPAVAIAESALTGRRVLVVETDVDALEYMVSTMTLHGATATGVSDRDEAWRLLAKGEFDAMVCGLGLNDDDPALALMRRIRSSKEKRLAGLPSASVGSGLDALERQTSLAAGFHIHLKRPIAPRELVSLVEELAPRS
jgi:signal transduction histidine kinase